MADVKRGIQLGDPPKKKETTLGALLDETAERDAIHIAVAPVVAAVPLAPGQHVGFIGDDHERVGPSDKNIGIVDPFLLTVVQAGQRCFLLLYPQTITSLRHQWTHPAFEQRISQVDHKNISVLWLTAFAENMGDGMNYYDLMDAAERWVRYEDHTVQHGSEGWRSSHPDLAEFWHHYEIVTGKRPKDAERWFFCCTC